MRAVSVPGANAEVDGVMIWERVLGSLRPNDHLLRSPVFIIGCGRSGTTILGQVLGRRSEVAYLNEPRRIWAIEPGTDIWSKQARRRGGRLTLDATDVSSRTRNGIRSAFAREVKAQGGTRLLEKLPINSFRVEFVRAIFPDAKFLHLLRDGIDVAQSIARLTQTRSWFGHDNYKWELLQAHARAGGEDALLAWCTDDFHRGLLEWRLSVQAAQGSLRALPADSWMELRYEEIIAQPDAMWAQLEKFMGLKFDEKVQAHAREQLARQSPVADVPLTPAIRAIAFDLLKQLGYVRE